MGTAPRITAATRLYRSIDASSYTGRCSANAKSTADGRVGPGLRGVERGHTTCTHTRWLCGPSDKVSERNSGDAGG